jgi:hypothetical protein
MEEVGEADGADSRGEVADLHEFMIVRHSKA